MKGRFPSFEVLMLLLCFSALCYFLGRAAGSPYLP